MKVLHTKGSNHCASIRQHIQLDLLLVHHKLLTTKACACAQVGPQPDCTFESITRTCICKYFHLCQHLVVQRVPSVRLALKRFLASQKLGRVRI